MVFLFVLTGIGAVLGGISLLIFGIFGGSAPQQAAGAAIAVAMAVIPYCLARAVQIVETAGRQKRYERQVLERLDKLIEAQSKARPSDL